MTLSTASNTTSYLLTIYHGINNWFYFQSNLPKTVYLFINHSNQSITYLHYYSKIYKSGSTYIMGEPYQKYKITILPGSVNGIFDLHAFRNKVGLSYTTSYSYSNILPFKELKYDDAEDGKVYNIESSQYNIKYDNYNVDNIPNIGWDPSYNILTLKSKNELLNYIYYEGKN